MKTNTTKRNVIALEDLTPCEANMTELQEKFETVHADWKEEDFQTYAWAGFGFPKLPTLEFYKGGIVLMLTKAQVEELNNMLEEGAVFEQYVESAFGEDWYHLCDIDEIFVVDAEPEKEVPAGWSEQYVRCWALQEALNEGGISLPLWTNSIGGAYLHTGGSIREDAAGNQYREEQIFGGFRSTYSLGWYDETFEDDDPMDMAFVIRTNSIGTIPLLVRALKEVAPHIF